MPAHAVLKDLFVSTLGLCLQRSQHALMLSPTSFTRTVRPYWPLNEQGLTVDYLESFDRSCCYFLSTLGLPAPHSEAIPQDRQSCVSGHSAVQLAGGLIRLAVHHWGQGIRSCLILPSAVESAHLPILRVPQLHVAVPRPHHDLQLGYRRMFVHPDFLRLLSCMPKGRVVQDTSPETAETADVCMYVCMYLRMYVCM